MFAKSPRFLHSILTLLALFWAGTLPANPVITEFMADNSASIQDEDGAFSDWIEVHNPTGAPIDLTDWCLTDDAADLDQWRFPAVTLQPGDFLIVWASGKNRRVPGQPLHTNFSLNADGDFLALVRPDGVTVEQDFGSKYPDLAENESYGVQFNSTTLLAAGASARYLIPTNGTLGTTWTGTGFVHTSWASGPTGIGFGLLVPGMTVRQVQKNTSYGALNSLATVDALLALAPGSPQIVSEATALLPTLNVLGDGSDGHYGANLSPPNGSGEPYAIKATGTINIPTNGTYTFGLSSDDGGRIRIDGVNVMVDDTNHGPVDHLGAVSLTAGPHAIEVVMWEGGGGDEVELYAAAGTFATWNAGMRLVGDAANGGLAVFTTPSVGSNVVATNIEGVMRNNNATAYVRVPFSASGPAGFTALSLKMRYNDGYKAYLNGTEIAAKNVPATLIYNSPATATRSDPQSLVVEPVNATAHLGQLLNGNNVLAIHGLNISANNGSFLVLPELVAGSVNTGVQAVFFDLSKTTPGSINGPYSLLGKVEDTQFSVKRGFFTAPFAVTITTPTAGATIRYTTDGSTPTATSGTLYSGPININGTTVLRAAAFKTGFQPTNVDTQTYLFLNDVVTQSANGTPPPGWPATSGTNQVLDYGMDPDIVNNANPAIGGAQRVKDALTAISTVCITTDLPNLFDMATPTGTSRGIYSNPGDRGFSAERAAALEMINPPDALHPNGTSEFKVNCGIRIRGGYSRDTSNPKHAFHLYFRGDYGDTKLKYPMFGRFGTDEFDQIDFRTAENYSWSFGGDSRNTFLREEATRVTQRDMGHVSSHLRYVHLYINGVYWGLFNTDERTEASFAESYFGGAKEDYDVIKTEQTQGYITGITDGTLTAWQDLWSKGRTHAANPTNANYFKMMGRAADGLTPTADPVLLDVDNLIDYMLLTFWTGNLDGCTSAFLGNDHANNYWASRSRVGTRGFQHYAHDFEHSFFNTGEDRTGPFITANQSDVNYANAMFLHQDLMGNLEYRMRFADRTHKHFFNGGALSAAAWTSRFNKMAAIIDTAIIAESARWGDAKVATPLNRNNWLNEKNYILNSYVPVRGNTVLAQLRADALYPTIDGPTMSPFGGYVANGTEVVMSAGAGIIYYTADGSDPRLIGGGIKPGAQIYTSNTSNETLVPLGATWKYLADGSNQGTNWRSAGFNDASWPSGPGELGYNDGDEATPVGFVDADPVAPGIQKNATTYFRKTFTATNISGITALTLNLKYDDQAIVYLNGQVAVNTGLPADPAYNYYSGADTPNENVFFTYNPSPAQLVEGTNTLAVEIHQGDSGSSDISFHMSLTATRSSTPTPFFITGNGEKPFRVRAYDTNTATWSALTDATFLINTEAASASNLAISEIMYHPAPPTAPEIAAGFDDAEDFEYVEFVNIGPKNIDLFGLYLYGPISFDFSTSLIGRILAPGARVLIVAKKSAFDFRYGTGKPVAGSYSGHLNNAGEQIVLYTPADAVISNVTYNDTNGWPTDADGGGYSLVRKHPNGVAVDDNNPANWRASVAPGGNAGANDAESYPAWKTANGVISDTADIDADGLNSFQEYGMAGRANVPDPLRCPRVSHALINVGGTTSEYATFTFSRRYAADDVASIVETTNSLTPTAWSAAGAVFVSATREADGSETIVYRSATPMSGPAQQCFRLRIVSPP
ncbi:MAG TPA: lamin tail domain-containing protein [Chthoniobacteraceae bacterium]|nr:lamin tail domain-containing protein [Chthoniobacteraceae bacterium]